MMQNFLLNMNFSLVKISKILRVSRSTIYHHMEVDGRCVQKYSFISNDALDIEVKNSSNVSTRWRSNDSWTSYLQGDPRNMC